MDMKQLRAQAKEGMRGFCKLCPVCDGRACAGQVPGMGGAITGGSFQANYEALRAVRLNMRTVHDACAPDTSFDFFGTRLSTPIMNGPIAGPNYNCGPMDDYGFQEAIATGVAEAGSIYWMGDPCKKEEVFNGCRAMQKAGRGIAISKPHIEQGKVRARFEWALEHGAVAFGMDLDGAGLITLRTIGYPVGPKTAAQIKELRAFAPGAPFIIKGIMAADDAKRCVDAGANCIVVSNHGGRVLDGTPGVAEVLPTIRQAVGSAAMVLADGSVRSGVDALKYLALGADAVLIGRPVCWGAFGGGAEGVQLMVDTYTDQLRQAMLLTGCKQLSDIGDAVVYRR